MSETMGPDLNKRVSAAALSATLGQPAMWDAEREARQLQVISPTRHANASSPPFAQAHS